MDSGREWAVLVLGGLMVSIGWWQVVRVWIRRRAIAKIPGGRPFRAYQLMLTLFSAMYLLWAADHLLPRAWYDNAVWLTVVWAVSLLGGVVPLCLLISIALFDRPRWRV